MAGVSAGAVAGGRRRSLDADINLVPFIDLLSMCISFLLLTAVWINIGAVQIKQSHGTDAASVTSKQYEMNIRFLGPLSVEVRTQRGHFSKTRVLRASNEKDLLTQLDSGLATWDETKSAKQIASVRVKPKASVNYGGLVNLMDVLRKHQIVNLAVLPGGES
jgi:biopolymer transport protein ExbD